MTQRGKRLEDAVKQVLDLYKVKWWRVSNYRCFRCGQVQNGSAKGLPDFICFHPDRGFFFVEAKEGKGRLTEEQDVFRKLTEQRAVFIVVRDNVDELIKFLKGGAK